MRDMVVLLVFFSTFISSESGYVLARKSSEEINFEMS